jgi:hypothetical protein
VAHYRGTARSAGCSSLGCGCCTRGGVFLRLSLRLCLRYGFVALLIGANRLLTVIGRLQCVGFDGVRDVVRDSYLW